MGVQVNFSSFSPAGYWSASRGYVAPSQAPASDFTGARPLQISNEVANAQIPLTDKGSEPSAVPNSGSIQEQGSSLQPGIHGDDAKNTPESSQKENTPPSVSGTRAFAELSQAEKQLVMELQQTDTRVHNHEMSHLTAAGSLAISGPSYTYQRGPDGQKYAVGGEVHIDSAPVSGDPEATLQKMEQVQRAALAPVDPSSQDRAVAAKAASMAAKARAELAQAQAQDGGHLQSREDASWNDSRAGKFKSHSPNPPPDFITV